MTEKSHVGMGYKVCPVCHTKHDEVVLLDKRLRNTLERDNMMGYALCPEHEAMSGEYLALVEMTGSYKDRTAAFTGNVAHVRRTVAAQIFGEAYAPHKWVAVEVGVIAKLQAMQQGE